MGGAPEHSCAAPRVLERLADARRLRIVWADGQQAELAYLGLRAQCVCARCVDEVTGERIVDVEGLDADVSISEMQLVGNYAVKIRWSDGHDTGLYTWEHLRLLCDRT